MDREVRLKAVESLKHLTEDVNPRSGEAIIEVLREILDVSTPVDVLKAALEALTELAPDDERSRAKVRALIEQDSHEDVVALAQRFLQSKRVRRKKQVDQGRQYPDR
jgi:hypothetical protein